MQKSSRNLLIPLFLVGISIVTLSAASLVSTRPTSTPSKAATLSPSVTFPPSSILTAEEYTARKAATTTLVRTATVSGPKPVVIYYQTTMSGDQPVTSDGVAGLAEIIGEIIDRLYAKGYQGPAWNGGLIPIIQWNRIYSAGLPALVQDFYNDFQSTREPIIQAAAAEASTSIVIIFGGSAGGSITSVMAHDPRITAARDIYAIGLNAPSWHDDEIVQSQSTNPRFFYWEHPLDVVSNAALSPWVDGFVDMLMGNAEDIYHRAYWRDHTGQKNDGTTVTADFSGVRTGITQLLNSFPSYPTPTPIPATFYYSKTMAGKSRICRKTEAGTEECITNAANDDSSPSLCPDGKTLVFTRNLTNGSKIMKMDLATRAETDLSIEFPSGDTQPTCNPATGQTIAYINNPGDLWLMNIDGSNKHQLGCVNSGEVAQKEINCAAPTFSPDGTRVAYSAMVGNPNLNDWERHILIRKVTDSGLGRYTNMTQNLPVPNGSKAEYSMPTFFPTGLGLVYGALIYSSLPASDWNLYRMNLDGSGSIQLTSDPASDGTPRFTIDGKFYFTSYRNGTSAIYRMNPGTSSTALAAAAVQAQETAIKIAGTESASSYFPHVALIIPTIVIPPNSISITPTKTPTKTPTRTPTPKPAYNVKGQAVLHQTGGTPFRFSPGATADESRIAKVWLKSKSTGRIYQAVPFTDSSSNTYAFSNIPAGSYTIESGYLIQDPNDRRKYQYLYDSIPGVSDPAKIKPPATITVTTSHTAAKPLQIGQLHLFEDNTRYQCADYCKSWGALQPVCRSTTDGVVPAAPVSKTTCQGTAPYCTCNADATSVSLPENTATGKSCTDVCSEQGKICVSVGLDYNATIGTVWAYGTTSKVCSDKIMTATCNSSMVSDGKTCGAKPSRWTRCRCK